MKLRSVFLSFLVFGYTSAEAAPILKDLIVQPEAEGYFVEIGPEVSFRSMQPNRVYAFYASESDEEAGKVQYRMAVPIEAELPGLNQVHDEYESEEYPIYSGRYAMLPVLQLAVNAVLPGQYFNTSGIEENIEWTSFRLIRGGVFEWVSTPTEERPHFRAQIGGTRLTWSMEQNQWRLNKAETYTTFELYIRSYTYLFMGRTYQIVNAPTETTIINIYLNLHHWRF